MSNIRTHKQPFHLIAPSPWPALLAATLGILFREAVFYFEYSAFLDTALFRDGLKFVWPRYEPYDLSLSLGGSSESFNPSKYFNIFQQFHELYVLNKYWPFELFAPFPFFLATYITILLIFAWLFDIWMDSINGFLTAKVRTNLRLGFILFVVSEIMLFFGFFWAFFHVAVTPAIACGMQWPPVGIISISPETIPFINTLLLLYSGFWLVVAHRALLNNNKNLATLSLWLTVLLATIFLELQLLEYKTAPFSLLNGVFGSVFFMLTGLHGLHVFLGTVCLFVALFRLEAKNKSRLFFKANANYHLGFELAAWYWHFVDVVWILLMISVYCWSYY